MNNMQMGSLMKTAPWRPHAYDGGRKNHEPTLLRIHLFKRKHVLHSTRVGYSWKWLNYS